MCFLLHPLVNNAFKCHKSIYSCSKFHKMDYGDDADEDDNDGDDDSVDDDDDAFKEN